MHDDGGNSQKKDNEKCWLIRKPTREEIKEMRLDSSMSPQVELYRCRSCRAGVGYQSYDEALGHLLQVHFQGVSIDEADLRVWIKHAQEIRHDEKVNEGEKLIDVCIGHIEKSCRTGEQIAEGVGTMSGIQGRQPIPWNLPSTLVQSFEQVMLFILAAGHVSRQVHRQCMEWNPGKEEVDGARLSGYRKLLSDLGKMGERSMQRAQQDVILLVRTGKAPGTIGCATAGPRYIVLLLCKQLMTRPIYDKRKTRATQLYEDFVSRMVSATLTTQTLEIPANGV